MTDVHEEAELGLAHLFGMHMGLQAQTALHAVMTVGEKLPGEETDDQGVEEISPCRTVPGTMHDDGEITLRRLHTTALSLHTEAVSAWRQVREREFVVASWQRTERLAVDAVVINDMLRVLIGQRGEVDGERVVVVAQHEVVAGADGGLGDLIATRTCGCAYRLTVDGESRQMDIGCPQRLLDVLGIEPCNTTDTTKDDGAIGGCARSTVTELIALQTIVGKVVHLCAQLGIEEGETMVGRDPQHAFSVALDRGNTVGGQPIVSRVFRGLLRLQVVTEEATPGRRIRGPHE